MVISFIVAGNTYIYDQQVELERFTRNRNYYDEQKERDKRQRQDARRPPSREDTDRWGGRGRDRRGRDTGRDRHHGDNGRFRADYRGRDSVRRGDGGVRSDRYASPLRRYEEKRDREEAGWGPLAGRPETSEETAGRLAAREGDYDLMLQHRRAHDSAVAARPRSQESDQGWQEDGRSRDRDPSRDREAEGNERCHEGETNKDREAREKTKETDGRSKSRDKDSIKRSRERSSRDRDRETSSRDRDRETRSRDQDRETSSRDRDRDTKSRDRGQETSCRDQNRERNSRDKSQEKDSKDRSRRDRVMKKEATILDKRAR